MFLCGVWCVVCGVWCVVDAICVLHRKFNHLVLIYVPDGRYMMVCFGRPVESMFSVAAVTGKKLINQKKTHDWRTNLKLYQYVKHVLSDVMDFLVHT